ncbi:hypothetical protein HHI36_002433, partial [Cryptolaemus montrouzieri]
ANRQIRDLFEDLRDGHNLISLLEVLTGEQLVSSVKLLFFTNINKISLQNGVNSNGIHGYEHKNESINTIASNGYSYNIYCIHSISE